MRLLLTGVTGFIGRYLLNTLLDQCPEIDILTVNNNVDSAELFFPSSKYKNCRHVHSSELNKVISFNPEMVFHLASLSTSRNDTEIIKPLITSNIEFGVNLLDSISQCSSMKLFVNIGSFAEYRLGPSMLNNAYLYSVTKTAFRHFVEYYSELKGFKYITMVPYSVYGGQTTVKRVVDFIIDSVDSSTPIKMTAGRQVLDFIHVRDVTSFFVKVIKDTELFLSVRNGEEFHIGTGRGTSIQDLAMIFERVSGKKCNIIWGGVPYRARETMYSVAPIAKNLCLLNWRANISLEDGVNELLLQKNINKLI